MPTDKELSDMYAFAKAIEAIMDTPANKAYFERLKKQQAEPEEEGPEA